ncbi:ankyrin repeat domain-containing protein [Spongorhabdus nitratireducens]
MTIQSDARCTFWRWNQKKQGWIPHPIDKPVQSSSHNPKNLKNIVALEDPGQSTDYLVAMTHTIWQSWPGQYKELARTTPSAVKPFSEPAVHLIRLPGGHTAVAGYRSGDMQLMGLPMQNRKLARGWIDCSGSQRSIAVMTAISDTDIAVAYSDGTLSIWHQLPPQSSWHEEVIGHEPARVTALIALSEEKLLTAAEDLSVKRWYRKVSQHKSKGWHSKTLDHSRSKITALAVLPDKRVIAGDTNGQLSVMEDRGNQWHCSPVPSQLHSTAVEKIIILPSGEVLTQAQGDCRVQIWEPPLPERLDTDAGYAALHRALTAPDQHYRTIAKLISSLGAFPHPPPPCCLCQTVPNPLCRVIYEVLCLPSGYDLKPFTLQMLRADNINFRDRHGTLLNRAVNIRMAAPLVKALLAAGADPHQIDQDGFTPVHKAIHLRNAPVLQMMVAQQMAYDLTDHYIVLKPDDFPGAFCWSGVTRGKECFHDCELETCLSFSDIYLSKDGSYTLQQDSTCPDLATMVVTPNQPDQNNVLPLQQAINDGSLAAVDLLMRAGANPTHKNTARFTLLHQAMATDTRLAIRIIESICEQTCHPEASAFRVKLSDLHCPDCQIPFCEMIHEALHLLFKSDLQNMKLVDHIIQIIKRKNIDCGFMGGLKCSAHHGYTLLRRAVVTPDWHPMIIPLLKAGADPNEKRYNQISVFHEALHRALPTELLLPLVSYGANMDGESIIHCGSDPMEGHKLCIKIARIENISESQEAIRLLVEGKINAVDEAGDSPLHRAIRSGSEQYPLTLIRLGADASLQDKQGFTPIHWAMEQRHPILEFIGCGINYDVQLYCTDCSVPGCELVHRLISKGYCTRFKNFDRGITELEHNFFYDEIHRQALLVTAAKKDDTETVRLLLKAGAAVHLCRTDKTGNTSAHLAAHNQNYDMLGMLLRYGADLTIMNSENETPLHEILASFPEAQVIQLLNGYAASIQLAEGVLLGTGQPGVHPALVMLFQRPDPVSEQVYQAINRLFPAASGKLQSLAMKIRRLPPLTCPVCYKHWINKVPFDVLPCGHVLCRTCQQHILKAEEKSGIPATCNMCRGYRITDGITVKPPADISVFSAAQQPELNVVDVFTQRDTTSYCNECSQAAVLNILPCGHLCCSSCRQQYCPQCGQTAEGAVKIFH